MKKPVQKVIQGFEPAKVEDFLQTLPSATRQMLTELTANFNEFSLKHAHKEASNGEIPIFFEMDELKFIVEYVAKIHGEVFSKETEQDDTEEKIAHKVVKVDLGTEEGIDRLINLMNILPDDVAEDINEALGGIFKKTSDRTH